MDGREKQSNRLSRLKLAVTRFSYIFLFQLPVTLGINFPESTSSLAGDCPVPEVNSVEHFLTLPFVDSNMSVQTGWLPLGHEGIDYKTGKPNVWPATNFEVRASRGGKAIFKDGVDSGHLDWGLYVFMTHFINGKTYHTYYGHLQSSPLPKGKEVYVRRGDLIGIAGNTGTKQIHLHFATKFAYAANNKDPYDLCKTREYYYPGGSLWSGPGSNHFWTTDTPKFYVGIPGDMTFDDQVNIYDYTLLYENFGWRGEPKTNPADVDRNGRVDILDYIILFEDYGKKITSISNTTSSQSLSTPNPPTDVTISFENNSIDTAVIVRLNWSGNSTDETGFLYTWNIEGYGGNSIDEVNEEPPVLPQLPEKTEFNLNNIASSVLAILPCEPSDSLRQVSVSISAYNDSGASIPVSGSGVIAVPACPIPGDANGDRKVDGIDYAIWFLHFDQSTDNGPADGDFNYDGDVDGIDYAIWLINFGTEG